MRKNFWEKYSLGELNNKEWEALCDGCGQCCLQRETQVKQLTVFSVACPLLDIDTNRCKVYKNRLKKVPTCHKLSADKIPSYTWLPESCTYRRLYRGEKLPAWHPLLVGNRNRMRKKGITVCRLAVAAEEIPKRKLKHFILKTKDI